MDIIKKRLDTQRNINYYNSIKQEKIIMEKDMRTITDVDGETYNYDNNSPMCLYNPWSGRPVEIKKSDKLNLDNWAILMDDELREHIHNQSAPCSDWDFIRAWYELVDTDEASRVILGS